jgi:hypothetical protein
MARKPGARPPRPSNDSPVDPSSDATDPTVAPEGVTNGGAGTLQSQPVAPASINTSPIEPLYTFVLGVFFLLSGLTAAVLLPSAPPLAQQMLTVLVALGAASFASGITGFLEVQSKWVRAGGPLGVLVFVCFFIARR